MKTIVNHDQPLLSIIIDQQQVHHVFLINQFSGQTSSAKLQVFFAPLVDYGAQHLHGGYKSLVMLLQGVMLAAIFALIPLLPEALEKGEGHRCEQS